MGSTILAVVSDLLIESRVEAAARLQGASVQTFAPEEAAAAVRNRDEYALLIADLAVVPDIGTLARAARESGIPFVAYYPHVDTKLRKGAERAGVEFLYPRSRFLRELPRILATRLEI
jgi:hypothetical protein